MLYKEYVKNIWCCLRDVMLHVCAHTHTHMWMYVCVYVMLWGARGHLKVSWAAQLRGHLLSFLSSKPWALASRSNSRTFYSSSVDRSFLPEKFFNLCRLMLTDMQGMWEAASFQLVDKRRARSFWGSNDGMKIISWAQSEQLSLRLTEMPLLCRYSRSY